jgi:hypothetical protein
MHAGLKERDDRSSPPIILPTIIIVLAMCDRIVCQVDRLGLALARQFEQRRDVAIVQLAGELQGPINEQADALAEEFFRSDRRQRSGLRDAARCASIFHECGRLTSDRAMLLLSTLASA